MAFTDSITKILLWILAILAVVIVVLFAIEKFGGEAEDGSDTAPKENLFRTMMIVLFFVVILVTGGVLIYKYGIHTEKDDDSIQTLDPEVASNAFMFYLVNQYKIPAIIEGGVVKTVVGGSIKFMNKSIFPTPIGTKIWIQEVELANSNLNGIHTYAIPLSEGVKAIEQGFFYRIVHNCHYKEYLERHHKQKMPFYSPKEANLRLLQHLDSASDGSMSDDQRSKMIENLIASTNVPSVEAESEHEEIDALAKQKRAEEVARARKARSSATKRLRGMGYR